MNRKKILKQPQVISRSLQIFPGHLTLGFPSVSLWITKYKQKQLTKPSIVGSPGGLVVKTSLSNAEGAGSIPCQEAKIPHGPQGERPLVELYLEPGVSSERCTEKLPLRVDFIHRLEFGEVSWHRVLIKTGPGNRGPTECGTTHEATSGMSS